MTFHLSPAGGFWLAYLAALAIAAMAWWSCA